MTIKNIFGLFPKKQEEQKSSPMRVLLRSGSVIELGEKHFKKDGSLRKSTVLWLNGLRAEMA